MFDSFFGALAFVVAGMVVIFSISYLVLSNMIGSTDEDGYWITTGDMPVFIPTEKCEHGAQAASKTVADT